MVFSQDCLTHPVGSHWGMMITALGYLGMGIDFEGDILTKIQFSSCWNQVEIFLKVLVCKHYLHIPPDINPHAHCPGTCWSGSSLTFTGVQQQYLLMGGHLLLLPTAPWTIYVSLDFCAKVFSLKTNYLPLFWGERKKEWKKEEKRWWLDKKKYSRRMMRKQRKMCMRVASLAFSEKV